MGSCGTIWRLPFGFLDFEGVLCALDGSRSSRGDVGVLGHDIRLGEAEGAVGNRTLLYAVQCLIQNCHILALMYAGFFDDSVRIRIGPTLLDPSPSAILIGHLQTQDLSA